MTYYPVKPEDRPKPKPPTITLYFRTDFGRKGFTVPFETYEQAIEEAQGWAEHQYGDVFLLGED